VRSNMLFSLPSPAVNAACVGLAGRSIGLLLRLFVSLKNMSMYVAMRALLTLTRLMRFTRTPAASRRMCCNTKSAKSEVIASSASWMVGGAGDACDRQGLAKRTARVEGGLSSGSCCRMVCSSLCTSHMDDGRRAGS